MRFNSSLLALAAVTALACGEPTARPCASSAACRPDEVCSAGACVAMAGGAGGGSGGAGGAGGSSGDGGPVVHRLVALELSPASAALGVGQTQPLAVLARFDDGATADVTSTVAWTLSPSGVVDVQVLGSAVALRGLAAGTATVVAKAGQVASNALAAVVTAGDGGVPRTDAGSGGPDGGSDGGRPLGPTNEVRAVWVTRFSYANANDVKAVIGRAAGAGFNVVFFQIRGAGDAFYHSSFEPWSAQLTGTLGKDPGWDPLQTAITEAHARGIQLHAYFNVFSAWKCPAGGSCTCTPATTCQLPGASAAGAPTHWLQAHPDSMVVDSSGQNEDTEYLWFSPADPAYRAHLLDTVRELLTTYAVDGLHLDRVRYPGAWASYDPASTAAWNALPSPKPARADWQRENVGATVAAIFGVMKQVRPQAVLSASVWGIHTRLPGCNTSEGYSQFFQDSIGWVDQSRIDWIVPMIYWDIGSGCTDWTRLLATFTGAGNARAPRVVAGMHALDNGVVQPSHIQARIQVARSVPTAGTSIFASAYLDGMGGWASYAGDGGVFSRGATVPPVSWR